MRPTGIPRTADAAARPRLASVAITWERIQLVVSALPSEPSTGGLAVLPDPVHLRQVRGELDPADPLASMAPTRAWTDGDRLYLRFNVMTGPGQMPLEPGRWRLESGGVPVMVDGASFDTDQAATRFTIARGEYTVRPSIDPAERSLLVDVDLDLVDPKEVARRRAAMRRGRAAAIRPYVGQVRQQVFRGAYAAARRLGRRTGRRILFASDSRAALGGNLEVVWDRMVERGLDRRYRMQTLLRPSIADRRSFRDRFRMPWLLATADVILIDDYMPIIYRIDDPDVRIIQLWHASGAFKTVGYSRVGKLGGPSPYSRVHKNYTYAIVSSDHDVPFYAEAFGIPEDRVVPTGIPRMDRFFDAEARAAGRASALRAFPAAEGRLTILFAPTFRGEPRDATYPYDLIDFAGLHALAVERDAVVIFKMHPFVREPLPIPDALTDRLIDGTATSIDVNDLMFVVDLLVTDYSSIVFEFSTLGRPMLFYAFDLDEYIADRDFYVPFETFVPGRIVRTFEALLDAIRREDYAVAKVHEFAARHFDHLDGTSTDRVIDDLVIGR